MLKPLSSMARRAQRGASLIELMVGLTVGLIVVAGAVSLFATQLSGTRRTTLEARMNQDMRSAADLIVRDLRRASYWQNALDGTRATGTGSVTTPNPYRAASSAGAQVEYAFSRDATEDNALGTSEHFGFRLTGSGELQMQVGEGLWNEIVDPTLVRVVAFTITPTSRTLPLGDLCPKICLPGAPNCPSTSVRRFDVLLRGQAVADASITRELRLAVRLRNDQLEGQCPT